MILWLLWHGFPSLYVGCVVAGYILYMRLVSQCSVLYAVMFPAAVMSAHLALIRASNMHYPGEDFMAILAVFQFNSHSHYLHVLMAKFLFLCFCFSSFADSIWSNYLLIFRLSAFILVNKSQYNKSRGVTLPVELMFLNLHESFTQSHTHSVRTCSCRHRQTCNSHTP